MIIAFSEFCRLFVFGLSITQWDPWDPPRVSEIVTPGTFVLVILCTKLRVIFLAVGGTTSWL